MTLPILERLAKFQGKINDLQRESEEAKIKAQVDEVSKMLKKADEDSESDESDIGQTQEQRLEKTKDILLKSTSEMIVRNRKKKEEKGYYEKLKEERNKYLMKGKKLKIKIIEQSINLQ